MYEESFGVAIVAVMALGYAAVKSPVRRPGMNCFITVPVMLLSTYRRHRMESERRRSMILE
jgi:hypothetical protein